MHDMRDMIKSLARIFREPLVDHDVGVGAPVRDWLWLGV
jgi:hypothetical protein